MLNPVPDSVAFAAFGYSQPHWLTSYYPSDLPEDWRLAYYANEFSHLYIPSADFPAELSLLSTWREELGEAVKLYFEVNTGVLSGPGWEALAAAIGQCHASVVTTPLLAPRLRDGGFSRIDLVAEAQGVYPRWQAAPDDKRQLLLMRSATVPDAMMLRRWFEGVQPSVAGSELVIIVDAPYQTIEKIRQMAELYGWP